MIPLDGDGVFYRNLNAIDATFLADKMSDSRAMNVTPLPANHCPGDTTNSSTIATSS